MADALKCVNELFKDSSDSIEGLVNFTNYFVKEFDCEAVSRSEIKELRVLNLYDDVTEKKECLTCLIKSV